MENRGRERRPNINLAKPECRVLFVFAVLGMGGAETWLMSLLKYWSQHAESLPIRMKVDICLTGGQGPFDDEARELGASLYYVPFGRRSLAGFIKGFRTLLSTGRYHVIHDQQDYMAGWHFIFGMGLLPRVRIAHLHNPAINLRFFGTTKLRRWTLSLGRRLLAHFATHILGTSERVVKDYGFRESSFERVKVGAAHCGFDVTRYRSGYAEAHADVCMEFGWEKSARILLFAGRLSSNCNEKNPQFTIEVAEGCIARDPRVHLLLAGSGKAVIESLRAQVAARGMEKRIIFLGERHDLPRLMCGCDLFLFPSEHEALGMVAVEAQAAGLPVLASTGVPTECVVIEEIVRFLPLAEPRENWIEAALGMLGEDRLPVDRCNRSVRESDFSIENSAGRLMRFYLDQPNFREVGKAGASVG